LNHEGLDDAAIFRLSSGKLILQTVDFFTPVVDNPYQFGQIAAANSLSDIYAMGGKPSFALNVVGFPINDLPKSVLTKILQGGADKAEEAGIPIVGGHSIDDKEPKFGLVVTGEIEEKNIWRNSGALVGDVLLLTKPLGTGIITTAIKKGLANKKVINDAVESMAMLNKDAAQLLRRLNVNSVTDVTGYGLLGHLGEICSSSQVSARINFQNLEFLNGTEELAKSGIIPGGTRRNLKFTQDKVEFDSRLSETQRLLLSDAQTSGGLLVSLPKSDAENFQKYSTTSSRIIGKIVQKKHKKITINY
tara:strand:- start:160 stop:1071 length:912 start_codon:yes stop_codon:yes gene_type:complete